MEFPAYFCFPIENFDQEFYSEQLRYTLQLKDSSFAVNRFSTVIKQLIVLLNICFASLIIVLLHLQQSVSYVRVFVVLLYKFYAGMIILLPFLCFWNIFGAI